MAFQFKSFQQILGAMITKVTASSPINDVNAGSVISTLLEAAAQEDFSQYFQMIEIIKNYSLDSTTGSDLDNRASEFGIVRTQPVKATGFVTISDSAVTKISTKIYAGLAGPSSGQSYINVDDSTGFQPTGSIVIGRDTANLETVAYTSIVDFTNFYRINLASNLINDHGTDETVIVSNGGNRAITAGTIVRVPPNDISPSVDFSITTSVLILDGESSISDVEIIAVLPGTNGNAPSGTIAVFDSMPFPTAVVENPSSLTNGVDLESDSVLRDRIKKTIQSLSRGTATAILNSVIGITDTTENKRVVSANFIDATSLNDIGKLYIDDGSGFEPSFSGQGQEIVLNNSTGGEQFLQLDFFPLVKAQIETLNAESFDVNSGETLTYRVDTNEETIVFATNDFKIIGAATAEEIVNSINNNATLIEARTAQSGTKVVLRAKTNLNESLTIVSGTSLGTTKLNFPTSIKETLYLYKINNDGTQLLQKDGKTASLENLGAPPYNNLVGRSLQLIVDGKAANPQIITFQAGDFIDVINPTLAEIVKRINLEMTGAIASITSNGQRITITSNLENNDLSSIQVTGGTANTGAGYLQFGLSAVYGHSKGYTLNRFNGQIELVNPLLVNDKIMAGTDETRAFFISGASAPFNLADPLADITIEVDGTAPQTAPLNLGGTASAQDVADALMDNINGILAVVVNNKVKISTNKFGVSGSLKITSVTGAASTLVFDIAQLRQNLNPHVAFLQSVNSAPFVFAQGSQLILVLDNDQTNKTFIITMSLDGTVTSVDIPLPKRKFIANLDILVNNFNTKFLIDNELIGYQVKFTSGSNIGETKAVTAYDAATGSITLASDLTNNIVPTDEFYIVPVSARNTVNYLNNTVTSTISLNALIEPSDGGTKIQITSLLIGSEGQVNVTGGSANAQLGFSTVASQGIDGYQYYTGLLRLAQRTVDGLDASRDTFPGFKAAGVQIEVLSPTVQEVKFIIDITLAEGIAINSVVSSVRNSVSSYVNGLGVGKDVILNEIIKDIMGIDGVVDVEITSPSVNIVIADNEIARVKNADLIIG